MPTQDFSSFDEAAIAEADEALRAAVTRIAADQKAADARATRLLEELSESQDHVVAVGDEPVVDLMERARPFLERDDLVGAWAVIAPLSRDLTLRRSVEPESLEWDVGDFEAPMAEPAGDIVERDD
jgi:hypothetical protein